MTLFVENLNLTFRFVSHQSSRMDSRRLNKNQNLAKVEMMGQAAKCAKLMFALLRVAARRKAALCVLHSIILARPSVYQKFV